METPVTDTLQPCRNCNKPLPKRAKYCPNCGQKNTTGKVSVWKFLQDAFSTIFSIDSQLIRTFAAIFVPGKLTLEYFKGRHKKYAPPFRLFFFIGLIHFTVISLVAFRGISPQFTEMQEMDREAAYRLNFLNEVDDFKDKLETTLDNNPAAQEAIGSLYSQLNARRRTDAQSIGYLQFQRGGNISLVPIPMAKEELYSLTEEEIFEKYNVPNDFLNQIFVRQELRLNKNPKEFFRFLMGQLIWMVGLMMFALALILKLIYARRNRYYVEHLVFSFHYHAFAFLIVTIPLLFIYFKPDLYLSEKGGMMVSVAFFFVLIYLYVAMKNVYGQGLIKTFMKFSLLNVSYLFIFTLFSLIGVVASLFIF